MNNGKLEVVLLGQGFTWLDTGTHESLVDATNFVRTIEELEHRKIACLEEIANKNNWIDINTIEKDFVNAWEEGYLIAIGTKSKSFENIFLRSMKQVYYHLIKKFSTVEQIKMFTGFGLYDKKFLDILRQIDDLTPFLRGMVAEYGHRYKEFKYEQGIRQKGKTSNNFYTLYDGAMLSFTSYTKIGLRIATFIGMITMIVSFLIGLIYFIMKIIWWDRFSAGMIPMLLGMLFLGSVQIFFIGMIGEYVLSVK